MLTPVIMSGIVKDRFHMPEVNAELQALMGRGDPVTLCGRSLLELKADGLTFLAKPYKGRISFLLVFHVEAGVAVVDHLYVDHFDVEVADLSRDLFYHLYAEVGAISVSAAVLAASHFHRWIYFVLDALPTERVYLTAGSTVVRPVVDAEDFRSLQPLLLGPLRLVVSRTG